MTDRIAPTPRLPGLRLLWCLLALSLAALALTVAWLIRPRGLRYGGDAFLSSVVGASGVLMALSAWPISPRADDA